MAVGSVGGNSEFDIADVQTVHVEPVYPIDVFERERAGMNPTASTTGRDMMMAGPFVTGSTHGLRLHILIVSGRNAGAGR